MTTEESAQELAKKFAAKGTKIQTKLEKALEMAGVFVASKAKSAGYVPVDTGMLRNSIANRVRAISGRITAQVGTAAEYAAYQEYGTGIYAEGGGGRHGGWYYTTPDGMLHFTMGNRPKKFLRRALDDSRDTVIKIITQKTREEL